MQPKRSRRAAPDPIRQRVAAMFGFSACGGRRTRRRREGRLARQMQPTALFQRQAGIHQPRHCPQALRPQGFLHGAVGIRVVLHLQDQQAARIEAEPGEAMAVGRRMALADDEERLSLHPRQVTRHEGEGEAQGRRLVALGFRRDLVRSPESEAVAGKPRIDMRDSQGQRLDAEGRRNVLPRDRAGRPSQPSGAARTRPVFVSPSSRIVR